MGGEREEGRKKLVTKGTSTHNSAYSENVLQVVGEIHVSCIDEKTKTIHYLNTFSNIILQKKKKKVRKDRNFFLLGGHHMRKEKKHGDVKYLSKYRRLYFLS